MDSFWVYIHDSLKVVFIGIPPRTLLVSGIPSGRLFHKYLPKNVKDCFRGSIRDAFRNLDLGPSLGFLQRDYSASISKKSVKNSLRDSTWNISGYFPGLYVQRPLMVFYRDLLKNSSWD